MLRWTCAAARHTGPRTHERQERQSHTEEPRFGCDTNRDGKLQLLGGQRLVKHEGVSDVTMESKGAVRKHAQTHGSTCLKGPLVGRNAHGCHSGACVAGRERGKGGRDAQQRRGRTSAAAQRDVPFT